MEFIQTIGKLAVRYHSFFEEGIVNTLIIATFTVLFGTIFGTLMSSMRMSKILPLRWFAVAYIEFIRGTPLMVQLMFIFYGLPMVGFTLPDISWIPNFSRFSAGIIAMSINSCAYVAEIIRSGVQAVDYGQMEAARSVGFSHGQAMRLVVLPQAVKNILPALGNEFVTVIKESSIVSVIGLADLMSFSAAPSTMSRPSNASSDASTILHCFPPKSITLPALRAEAMGRSSPTGNLRSSRIFIISWPTAPVAPRMPTL